MTRVASASPRSDFESLRAHADFQRVFKVGNRRRCGGLVVLEASNDLDVGRVGIIASRKVGDAVRRNRVKRRLREAVRAVGIPKNRDYVVIASASVATIGFSTLLGWVEEAMNKGPDMEEIGNDER